MTKPQELTIKPQRKAYLGMAILKISFVIAIVTAIMSIVFVAGITSGDPDAKYALMIVGSGYSFFLLIMGLIFVNCLVAYNKESYTLSNDRIIIKRGGILSNSQTEMVYRNFTFVDYKLPFIEHGLFKTGELLIRSSGSSVQSDIALASLADPVAVYENIKEQMLANGFNLNQEQLVFETYPDTIGIVLNIIRKNSGLVSILFFVNIFAGIPLSAAFENLLPIVITALLSIVLFALAVVVRFLDLQKRHYRVFTGIVRYNKGFLTKHDAFIPVENISDSNTSQSFLQRIFGVYDIEISSKGVGTEIFFKNLKNGTAVEKAVDSIVLTYNQSHSSKTVAVKHQTTATPKILNRDEKLWNTTEFEAKIKMNILAALVKFTIQSFGLIIGIAVVGFGFLFYGSEAIGYLFYLVVIGFSMLVNLFNQFFKIFFTKYSIQKNSIKEEFKFLTTSNKEFNIQKVTGIVIIRDLLDRLLGTCSIKFISIGSAQDITFHTISLDQEFIQGLKDKFSFVGNESETKTIKSNFNFKEMFLANLPGYITLSVLIIIAFIVLSLIAAANENILNFASFTMLLFLGLLLLSIVLNLTQYIYGSFYHKKSKLILYTDRFVLKKGLINLSETYARYGNIKNIQATCYPFTKSGKLQINIAGELIPPQNTETQYQRHQQANSFAWVNLGNKPFIEFVDAAFDNMDVVEDLIHYKAITTVPQANVGLQAKSSMANGIVPFGVIALFLPFLWIALPFVILQIHKRRYEVEQDRIVCYSGILNLSKTSVLFARIDNINIRQGVWNKIFKTATVLIETIGSTTPVLTIEDIPNHQEVFELLKAEYQKKA